MLFCFFFFTDMSPTEIYTLSLHDALPILKAALGAAHVAEHVFEDVARHLGKVRVFGDLIRVEVGHRELRLVVRSEEHTSELQSHSDLVCRLLLEKKKKNKHTYTHIYRHQT